MRVRVRCFAVLADVAVDRTELDLATEATIEDAWASMVGAYPGLARYRPYVRAARNAAYARWTDAVGDGDDLAFLPPVSGGATTGLTDGAIDVAALERAVADPRHGAIVTFVGRARDRADDGREVLELEYEVYAEMAASVLDEVARDAEARWPVIVAVVHRHGLVPIGEAAVAIAVGSMHRAEAYEASRFVIDEIKSRLPIWKRERFVDGTEWKRPGA